MSFLAVDEFTRGFSDTVSGDTKKRVLVLGAGYGTLVNQLLESSRHNGSKFVVNDLSDNQMAIFKDRLPREFDSRVSIISGNFLEAADFPPNHFDHILLQNVLHFFDPDQTETFFNRAQLWLKNGGDLTVTCCTPFWQIHHEMRNEQGEDNIAIFEHKKAAGEPWPGYFSNIQETLLAMQHPIAAKAPKRVHAFDTDTLPQTMTRYGLTAVRSAFLKRRPHSHHLCGWMNVSMSEQLPINHHYENSKDATLKKIIAAGMIGEVLEWYDFTLYGFFAPVLAVLFFPHHNPFISILATFGGFAAGYFMRPIGGAFFGHLGDKFGRKKVLALTLVLMAIPTFCMGLLPTYADIGIYAPAILIFLRMMQGFSCGGEYTGSIIFLYEHATPHRRGLFSSLAIMGSFVGGLLSVASIGITSSILSHQELLAWGWRIPFLVGIITAIIGFYVRLKVSDTPVFEQMKNKSELVKLPIKNILQRHKKTLMVVASLNIQAAVLSYIVIMYMPTYLTSIAHIPMSKVMLLNLILMLTIMLCTPLIGFLSDKLSGKSLLIIASLGTVLFTYPVYHLFLQPNIDLIVIGEIIFGLLTATGMNAAAKIMTGISSPELRYSCVSVGHGICDSIFGGTAPFMATLLVSTIGLHVAPAYYIIFAGIITLFSAWKLKSEGSVKEGILQSEAQLAR